jgi:hypothetical protein
MALCVKRRFITLLLVGALSAGMVACGDDTADEPAATSGSQRDARPSKTVPGGAEPAAGRKGEDAGKPTSTDKGKTKPSDGDAGHDPPPDKPMKDRKKPVPVGEQKQPKADKDLSAAPVGSPAATTHLDGSASPGPSPPAGATPERLTDGSARGAGQPSPNSPSPQSPEAQVAEGSGD